VLSNDLGRIAGVRLNGIHFQEQGQQRAHAAKPRGATGHNEM
jgi:hypothetical protein